MRTWDDSAAVDSEEAASLDHSTHKDPSNGNDLDLSQFVDENSRGARGHNGLYALKDVDMGDGDDAERLDESDDDNIIARAINKTSIGRAAGPSTTADSSREAKSRFGTLASLFSRLTGSTRTITKEDLEPVLAGMQEHLMQKNVAQEIAVKICEGIGENLVEKRVSGYRGRWIQPHIMLPFNPRSRSLFQESKLKCETRYRMLSLAFLRPRRQRTSCYLFAPRLARQLEPVHPQPNPHLTS